MLAEGVPQLSPALERGIYHISTALIDPDIPYADERTILFSDLTYYSFAVHNHIYSHHVQPGYWDQNIRTPGMFMPRAGGSQYKVASEHVLKETTKVDRVYVESWNEYNEGSGIFAADPARVYLNGSLNGSRTDTWSSTQDPFEYIRTTASGASALHHRPGLAASIIWHDIPHRLRRGESTTATVVIRNEGSHEWQQPSAITLSIDDCGQLLDARTKPLASGPDEPGAVGFFAWKHNPLPNLPFRSSRVGHRCSDPQCSGLLR